MSSRLTISPTTLQELRLRAVLSREQLAEKAEISYATVKAIETGAAKSLRPQTVQKIADALGCSAQDLATVVKAAS